MEVEAEANQGVRVWPWGAGGSDRETRIMQQAVPLTSAVLTKGSPFFRAHLKGPSLYLPPQWLLRAKSNHVHKQKLQTAEFLANFLIIIIVNGKLQQYRNQFSQ
jgi:hypothetical protein